jgi:DNA repair protein RadC
VSCRQNLPLSLNGLSDTEIVALVLSAGFAGKSRADTLRAQRLLEEFGSLRGLVAAGPARLARVASITRQAAAALAAAGELAKRTAAESLERGQPITALATVHQHFGPLLRDEKREIFYALLLDSKNRLIARTRISEGSLTAALVHPREAFRPAVCEAAAAVVFIHNHPSGDPRPSHEDRDITGRLVRAGRLLGIPVLDHVVVASRGIFRLPMRASWKPRQVSSLAG